MCSQYLSVLFYEEVELEPEVAAAGTLDELYHAFVEPLRPPNIRRMLRMWEAFSHFMVEREISRTGADMGGDNRHFQLLPSTQEEPRRPGDVPRRVGTGQNGNLPPPTSLPQTASASASAANALES